MAGENEKGCILIVNTIILPRREIRLSSKQSEVLNFMHGFLIIEITYSFSMTRPICFHEIDFLLILRNALLSNWLNL